MEEDSELREIQEMELAYAKACDLHRQYEFQVIQKRLLFRENCPHVETSWSNYEDPLTEEIIELEHCKRCSKLIKRNIK